MNLQKTPQQERKKQKRCFFCKQFYQASWTFPNFSKSQFGWRLFFAFFFTKFNFFCLQGKGGAYIKDHPYIKDQLKKTNKKTEEITGVLGSKRNMQFKISRKGFLHILTNSKWATCIQIISKIFFISCMFPTNEIFQHLLYVWIKKKRLPG